MVLLCSAAWHGVCFVRVLARAGVLACWRAGVLACWRVLARAGVFVAMHCHPMSSDVIRCHPMSYTAP
jgi:hypothetical protein